MHTRNDFSLLLDELHAADTARQRAPLRKAAGDDWVADWIGTRRERQAALTRGSRHLHASFKQLNRQADAMAKAMPPPAPKLDPREHLAKAYSHFTKLVAEGRLSAIDVCRAEARFHHLAEALR